MPVTLTNTMSAVAELQKSAHSSIFMTEGSCSVMLLWPTRRTFSCHGSVVRSIGASRGGSGTSFATSPATVISGLRPAECSKLGCSTSIAAVNGRAVAPVLRKLRRLSTRVTLLHRKRLCAVATYILGPKLGPIAFRCPFLARSIFPNRQHVYREAGPFHQR